jgi:hypothetical protein
MYGPGLLRALLYRGYGTMGFRSVFFFALCVACGPSFSEDKDLLLPLAGGAERVFVTESGIVVGAKARVELEVSEKRRLEMRQRGRPKVDEKGTVSAPHLVLRKFEIPGASAPAAAPVATALLGVEVEHWFVGGSRDKVLVVATDIEGTCLFEGPNNAIARLWLRSPSFGTQLEPGKPLGYEEAGRAYLEADRACRWTYVDLRDGFRNWVHDVLLVDQGVCVGLTSRHIGEPDYKPVDLVWIKPFSTDPLKWLDGGRKVLAGQFTRIAATSVGKNLLLAVCKRDGGLAIFSTALEGEENKATEDQVAEGERQDKATISDLSAATFSGQPVVLVCSSSDREPGKSGLAFYTKDAKTRQWRVQQARFIEGSVRSASIGVIGAELVYAYLLEGKQELHVGKLSVDELGLKP